MPARHPSGDFLVSLQGEFFKSRDSGDRVPYGDEGDLSCFDVANQLPISRPLLARVGADVVIYVNADAIRRIACSRQMGPVTQS